jgi:2-haloacid dehalogenase
MHTRSPLIRAVAFDAYGTLFDVYSIRDAAERLFPGRGDAVAQLWRDKQLEYTRVRTLCDRYATFWQCTADALAFSARKLGLDMSAVQRDELLAQYFQLKAFDDCAPALGALRAMGLKLAVLSNGNPEMLDAAVAANGLRGYFDHLLSAHSVRRFKTAPEVYGLGLEALGCNAEEILFASSNGWDVAGATWFGFTTFWVNRSAQPMEELTAPHAEGRSLHDLVEFACRGASGRHGG